MWYSDERGDASTLRLVRLPRAASIRKRGRSPIFCEGGRNGCGPSRSARPSSSADEPVHVVERDMAAERIARRFTMAGRRALVTGGSLSIGRAIVLAFADAGADVAIHSAAAADAAFGRPDAAAETA